MDKMRWRLVSAAGCAIRIHRKEVNRKAAVRQLRKDLISGPNHCFGNHQHCSPDFCSTTKERFYDIQGASALVVLTQGGEPSDVVEIRVRNDSDEHICTSNLDCKKDNKNFC